MKFYINIWFDVNIGISKVRWLFSTALRIPTVHNFVSLAHTHEDVRIQIVRDFPQTKLDSEINAPFLLNTYTCVSHFLFHDFNKNSILNN